MEREADAPIFAKLGFTYGKAVRFKKEFQAAHGRHSRLWPSSPAVPAYKPTMADMSSMSPEMKQLYLIKYVLQKLGCFRDHSQQVTITYQLELIS